jgi:gentisate 1,2-dioxygenase
MVGERESIAPQMHLAYNYAQTVGVKHLWSGFQIIEPGKGGNVHSHPYEEVYFVLSGNGLIRGEEEEHAVGPFDTIFFPPRLSTRSKTLAPRISFSFSFTLRCLRWFQRKPI